MASVDRRVGHLALRLCELRLGSQDAGDGLPPMYTDMHFPFLFRGRPPPDSINSASSTAKSEATSSASWPNPATCTLLSNRYCLSGREGCENIREILA